MFTWTTSYSESESEVAQSCPTLCNPVDCSPPGSAVHEAPLSMGFSRQEYWSGLPFPSPRDLPDPGIKPRSPALQADALTSEPPGKPTSYSIITYTFGSTLSFYIWRKWDSEKLRNLPSITEQCCGRNGKDVFTPEWYSELGNIITSNLRWFIWILNTGIRNTFHPVIKLIVKGWSLSTIGMLKM